MDKLGIIVKAMSDKFGENIIAMDMTMASPLFDTFVLCSASNERTMNAIRESVEDELAKEGFFPKHIEGLRDSKWILMDYGDIIVHIFENNERESYNLEKLWADMPKIDIEEYL